MVHTPACIDAFRLSQIFPSLFLMPSSHLTVKVLNTFSFKLLCERVPLLASSSTYILVMITFLFLPDLLVVLDFYVQQTPGPPPEMSLSSSDARIADTMFPSPCPVPGSQLHEGYHCCLHRWNGLWGTVPSTYVCQ